MRSLIQTLRLPLTLGIAAILLAVGAVSFGERVGASSPLVGVEWTQSAGGAIAMFVDENSIAWNAGIRPGDRLLTVDGDEIRLALEASQIGWEHGSGNTVEIEVRRGAEDLVLSLMPGRETRTEPYTYLAIVGMAFWATGLFITLRWPRIRGGRLYTALALALFTQLTFSHTGNGGALDWVIYWGDVAASALVPALLIHLGVLLTRKRFRQRPVLILTGYGVGALLFTAALWLSPQLLGGVYRFDDPVRAAEWPDRLSQLLFAVALIVCVTLIAKSYRASASALHRGQMRWLLWGLALGLGPFAVLYAAPWALGASELPLWAQFVSVAPMLFVPAAFTAALARYRPYDVDLFLLRGICEVSSIFAASAIYAATVFLVREFVGDWFDLSRSASRYFGLFAMIASYPSLRAWVKAGVDRAFYRRRYSYRATLLDWARELSADTDLPTLLENLRRRVRDTLDVEKSEVAVKSGDGRFDCMPTGSGGFFELESDALARLDDEGFVTLDAGEIAEVPWARYLFAMKVKGTLRAALCVGERTHPQPPLTTEDCALLRTLAAHAATAFEAARLVREVRQRAVEIEQLHARQTTLLDASAVGLLLMDADGIIQEWNPAIEEIYGIPRDEALGREIGDVFPLHVVRRLQQEGDLGAGIDGARIFRLSLTNRAGRRIVANLSISRTREGFGGASTVVTFDDVSERVDMEEQMARQERLASLGMLAAGVAHEINTPLTGISSYAQMLLEGDDRKPGDREVLQKIESQTERASRITQSLLSLARSEPTALEALDLNATAQEVLQLYEPQVRGRGVTIEVDLDPSIPMIRGHKGKLQQVILNLLINARDAVGDAGTIKVRSHQTATEVALEIRDDGEGIAAEDLPSIFDPFFTTKGRGKGTGLGLSISYGIVREHGGEIRVDSERGKYTRFRVELPIGSTARAMA
ncbi:MAG: ATP-binding protein [Acidobacteriota bacterium]|nr:ATP-binding protein [Acidobacteriota bacterium]MDH3784009.1 ATP-binding protein [Acidobacteriota bacterium]